MHFDSSIGAPIGDANGVFDVSNTQSIAVSNVKIDGKGYGNVNFDASRMWFGFKSAATVQSPALQFLPCIRF